MKNQLHTLNYLKFNKILKCASELEKISKTKDNKTRRNLIHQAKNCVIDAISEIALNCLKGNIPLNKCDFKKLSKYQTILRILSKPSLISKRNQLIQQRGGFLQLLIPPALSLVASIVGDLIGRKIKK